MAYDRLLRPMSQPPITPFLSYATDTDRTDANSGHSTFKGRKANLPHLL